MQAALQLYYVIGRAARRTACRGCRPYCTCTKPQDGWTVGPQPAIVVVIPMSCFSVVMHLPTGEEKALSLCVKTPRKEPMRENPKTGKGMLRVLRVWGRKSFQ